jgi:hypothetical protein
MFSIPSCDLETQQDITKDLQRSSLSTLCSISSCDDEGSSLCAGKEDGSMKIDWENVEEKLMSWFASKAITAGNPKELIDQHRENQKKLIGLRSVKSESQP